MSQQAPFHPIHDLGLTEPIISAPMAGVSGGALASAVRAAGGLGLVAVGHGASEELIRREMSLAADAARPAPSPAQSAAPATPAAAAFPGSWGVGLMAWSLELDASALDTVLEYSPPVVALAAGDPTAAAKRAHQAGARVAVQVGNAAELAAAESDPYIDLIVVRGAEGGGHGLNDISTLPLLQLALSTCHKPVGAAGGIATAAGVAAVLGSGAVAAWVGTRFIPCSESLSPAAQQAAVSAASVSDTVYTSVFDLSLGIPWPREYGGRALANQVTDTWAGSREDALRAGLAAGDAPAMDTAQRVRAARAAGDPTAAPVYAGQSAGLVPSTATGASAASVVQELAGFREILRRAAGAWGTAG
ncbi:NAD(P)H-dependent flavin oxidoreductase [Galactobacter caseinivorans]|uniref:Nitronate monooxygenase n=1 Tax=Galactobacter caseinivorans TaxID=2676123 RepID=A0A496PF99_9MICC|nr:nitronate monooxygenase [Galactobacter caseinivorans]RKW69377.1 nitronate monooxygenase [Galactobacter caseinivorans]